MAQAMRDGCAARGLGGWASRLGCSGAAGAEHEQLAGLAGRRGNCRANTCGGEAAESRATVARRCGSAAGPR